MRLILNIQLNSFSVMNFRKSPGKYRILSPAFYNGNIFIVSRMQTLKMLSGMSFVNTPYAE
jgi:hypothetical protein